MIRTQDCGLAEARVRLDQARHFLEVAEVVQDNELDASLSVAASLAILAGIAAADAACCVSLGRRARGQDHRDAERIVADVPGVGADMAKALRRLLNLKDDAHYGMLYVSHANTTVALRGGRRLLELAERVVLS
ncbi:MAG: hypothetical protein GXY03_03630 [Solirubrobacterales bacterium]|nr:hypothetical protein [Solirubrobacterales bacterium]